MLGQIAIGLLLLLGFLLYPLIKTAWIMRNRTLECLHIESANPGDLPTEIQDALEASICALESAEFEFLSHYYVYAGAVGDLPAWGLMFRNSASQTYATIFAPQPFHQHSIAICEITSFLENNHRITTNNSKDYKIRPRNDRETIIYRLNTPIEELLAIHQSQLETASQKSLSLTEPEFIAKVIQHELEKLEYCVKRRVFRWLKPNEQYQYTMQSAVKLTFQVALELIFPKTRVKSLEVKSEEAKRDRVQSEAEAFLANLAPKSELSKQKRGWLVIGSLAIFAATCVIQFGQLEFGLTFVGIFLGTLILHEGGHLAAMMIFGYRSPAVFFIPFFGALATARKNHASLTEKFWISMAGPLPGLILGIAIALVQTHGLSEIAAVSQWYSSANPWRIASIILIFLNLFNLLPIYPLDGGQIGDLLLFSRNPYLGVLYRSIGVGLLLLLGLMNPTMLAFGLIIAFTIPNSYRIAHWSSKLRKELRNIPWQDERASAELIFTRLQSAPKMSPTQRQMIAGGIFADRRSDSAPLRSRIGLSIVYVISLVAGITAGLYSIMPSPKMMLGFARGMPSMFQSREARTKQSIQELDAKILQEPKNPEYYSARGMLKSLSNDFQGALADANTAIQINPASPDGYEVRSRIYTLMGDHNRAQADDHKAREIVWLPKFQAAHTQIKQKPKNLAAYIQRAEAKYELGNQQGAFQDLEYVIKHDPKNVEALFLRSSLYDLAQKPQAAMKDLDRIIELQPDNYEAYDARSEIYSQLGDDVKAEADAEKSFEIYSQSPKAKDNPQQIEMLQQIRSRSKQFD